MQWNIMDFYDRENTPLDQCIRTRTLTCIERIFKAGAPWNPAELVRSVIAALEVGDQDTLKRIMALDDVFKDPRNDRYLEEIALEASKLPGAEEVLKWVHGISPIDAILMRYIAKYQSLDELQHVWSQIQNEPHSYWNAQNAEEYRQDRLEYSKNYDLFPSEFVYGLNGALDEVATRGDMDMVTWILTQIAPEKLDFAFPVKNAFLHKHNNIGHYFLQLADTIHPERRKEVYEFAASGAAGAGDTPLAETLIQKGSVTDLGYALLNAACNGHLDTVKRIYELGGRNVGSALWCAIDEGYPEIIDFLIDKVDVRKDYMSSLSKAVEKDDYEIAKRILDITGGEDVNVNTKLGVSRSQRMADLLRQRGATDFNRGLQGAVKRNDKEMATLFLLYGATDLNKALLVAAEHGQVDMVRFLLNEGATDIVNARKKAREFGWRNVLKVLELR